LFFGKRFFGIPAASRFLAASSFGERGHDDDWKRWLARVVIILTVRRAERGRAILR
jgi:hypothetical protein